MPLVLVAVPVPFLDLLTYNVPGDRQLPPIGARVRVPVGTRTLTGCVVGHEATPQPDREIKDIVEAMDDEPFLPAHVVELCRWVADYYISGIGDAIAVAMPPGARARATSFRKRRVASLTAHGRSAVPDLDPTPVAPVIGVRSMDPTPVTPVSGVRSMDLTPVSEGIGVRSTSHRSLGSGPESRSRVHRQRGEDSTAHRGDNRSCVYCC